MKLLVSFGELQIDNEAKLEGFKYEIETTEEETKELNSQWLNLLERVDVVISIDQKIKRLNFYKEDIKKIEKNIKEHEKLEVDESRKEWYEQRKNNFKDLKDEASKKIEELTNEINYYKQ